MPRLWLAFGPATLAALAHSQSLRLPDPQGTLTVSAANSRVIRVAYIAKGGTPAPTVAMDGNGLRSKTARTTPSEDGFSTDALTVRSRGDRIEIDAPTLHLSVDRAGLRIGQLKLYHNQYESLYGMRGTELGFAAKDSRNALSRGLTRNDGAEVKGGFQGDGGAPFAYTNRWGLYVDSIDGNFTNASGELIFKNGSRKDIEAYIVVGPPKESIRTLTQLTGTAPLAPIWTLGFMNSQWGADETSVREIVGEYRKRDIPLDAFIFDFDFKAWGEDDYGEFRWNSAAGLGATNKAGFPNGASGKFAEDLGQLGVNLVGIMKPRILTEMPDHTPTKAAAEVTAHGWWYPNRAPYRDYFSHRLANDLDLGNPGLRAWFWKQSSRLFQAGIKGWWNDEADEKFDSLGHFNMARALYEGQRAESKLRVWSLNRNSYAGAQRFGYAVWSGDIQSGFRSMAAQRTRMLASVGLGMPNWSMDTGGFSRAQPNPENYARWMEFAAMVPVMRVHASFGKRRQPWLFGPEAEKAAVQAIRWRYSMIPTLYALEKQSCETGVGIVRPLHWEFPEDQDCANTVDSWMIGNDLLVSPVVEEGQNTKEVYLPQGTWYDFWTDRKIAGGARFLFETDAKTWQDMPIFVREGAILVRQPVADSTAHAHPTELTIDIWPSKGREGRTEIYADDGTTYAYEKGESFTQQVSAKVSRDRLLLRFAKPSGKFKPSFETYSVRVHAAHLLSFRVRAGEDVRKTISLE